MNDGYNHAITSHSATKKWGFGVSQKASVLTYTFKQGKQENRLV